MPPAFRLSTWDPAMIVAQMAALQSLFYLVLTLLVGLLHLVSGSTAQLSLDSLLASTAVDLSTSFGWLKSVVFVGNGAAGGYMLVLIVQRARRCFDFTATCFFYHLIFVCLYSGSFPASFSWWLVHTTSLIVMSVIGEYLCMQAELEPIALHGASLSGSSSSPSNAQRGNRARAASSSGGTSSSASSSSPSAPLVVNVGSDLAAMPEDTENDTSLNDGDHIAIPMQPLLNHALHATAKQSKQQPKIHQPLSSVDAKETTKTSLSSVSSSTSATATGTAVINGHSPSLQPTHGSSSSSSSSLPPKLNTSTSLLSRLGISGTNKLKNSPEPYMPLDTDDRDEISYTQSMQSGGVTLLPTGTSETVMNKRRGQDSGVS